MRKRLVRKTFDMIQDIAESENKEVRDINLIGFLLSLRLRIIYWHVKELNLITGLQEILGELWQVFKVRMHWGYWKPQAHYTTLAVLLLKEWGRTDKFRWLYWKHEREPEGNLLFGNWQPEKCQVCSVLGEVDPERHWGMCSLRLLQPYGRFAFSTLLNILVDQTSSRKSRTTVRFSSWVGYLIING